MQGTKSQLLSWAKFAIGWPLSFISIAFIVKFVYDKSSEININLKTINFSYLAFGVILFFIYFLMRSFLWRKLLEEKGGHIGFRENTYKFAFSEIKRYTPGNVWSFLSRASLFSEAGIDKRTVGIALLADIQLVVIGCAVVSLFSIPWILQGAELQDKLVTFIPFSIILIIVYFVGTGIIYRKRYDKDSSLLSCLILPGFGIKSKLKVSIISVVTYTIFGAANFFVLLSIYHLGFNYLVVLSSFFVFSLLVGYLTFITPMGLGVRELVVSLGLTQIITPADAGAVSIFTRVILVISELSFLTIIFVIHKSFRETHGKS